MTNLPAVQALRCFVAVAQDLSISKAAARLHLSQPAVSLQLKHLEDITGLQLFVRTGRGFVITEHGAALLPRAQAALGSLGEFASLAQRLRQPEPQALRIGTILDAEFIRLGAFLNELITAAPSIVIELRYGISDEMLAQLMRQELDVCFYLDSPANALLSGMASSPGAAAFTFRPLRQFVFQVVAPPGWQSRVDGKSWTELAALPWLDTPKASASHRLLAAVFGPLGVEPEHPALTNHPGVTLDLVESGLGLCLVRQDIAAREAAARRLVIAPQAQIDCVMSFVALASRAQEAPIAQALAAMERAWPPAPSAQASKSPGR